ncbi:MAG: hydroxymethylbilane synthase [Planktomarina sp.]|jgi:hydroxymethylbilane synthase|nr:hydroxymethylbilane synthase [Planktomarina sp.]MDS9946757.1 hydroxymethylbilane synthase [Planktomarina sp.]|tara:strand:+ start:1652 stop:2590 length:939 start_codon:yes stop_codon:yes gene_type:complete
MKDILPSELLKIGTRGSPLALAQAAETRARLMAAWDLPESAFEIVVIQTSGDRIQDRPLRLVGGKGLFTKEIEEQLLDGRIDIAVHSMKDMPTHQPDGLVLDTYLPREDVRDAFVSPTMLNISELPQGARAGTSSLRRRAQLLNFRPDLEVVEFRGNVHTRLKKLENRLASCTFLAMAGLNRLNVTGIGANAIDTEDMLPAVGQGAIGIERRSADEVTGNFLKPLNDVETEKRLVVERAFLATLDGSCQTPIAGLAVIEGSELILRGEVLRPDGTEKLSGIRIGSIADGVDMGHDLATYLLSQAGPDFFSWR